jgi:hypothetical protein
MVVHTNWNSSWLTKTTLGEREISYVYTHTHAPIFACSNVWLVTCDVRPLRAVRLRFILPQGHLRSSTLTVYFVYLALIIKVPTKSRGEPMIPLVAMGLIHLVFVLVLMNIHEIWLKLKSGFIIICKFWTFHKPYSCIYSNLAMAGPSDAMKPGRFGSDENFRHCQNKVKF